MEAGEQPMKSQNISIYSTVRLHTQHNFSYGWIQIIAIEYIILRVAKQNLLRFNNIFANNANKYLLTHETKKEYH